MRIWKSDVSIETTNARNINTAVSNLGIEFLEVGDDYVSARMPVDNRTVQPFGILHGGASVVLAETIASWGATFAAEPGFLCVGQEINANHVRSARSGWVTGTARPIHIGRTSHVWGVEIVDEAGKLVCVCRMTAAILPRPKAD